MKEQMIQMLVDKQLDELTQEELIEEKRQQLERKYNSEDVLTHFRSQFPELCAPEMTDVIERLYRTARSIYSASSHQGRLSGSVFSRWEKELDNCIAVIRKSAIRLPEE